MIQIDWAKKHYKYCWLHADYACISCVAAFNSFTATGDNNTLFANSIDPDETAHNEPSHLDLRCLTFSLSTLHIHFPSGTLFKKNNKKTDDKYRLKFGTERVNGLYNTASNEVKNRLREWANWSGALLFKLHFYDRKVSFFRWRDQYVLETRTHHLWQ